MVWALLLDSCDCLGPAVRQHSTVGVHGEGWTARSLTSVMKQKEKGVRHPRIRLNNMWGFGGHSLSDYSRYFFNVYVSTVRNVTARALSVLLWKQKSLCV